MKPKNSLSEGFYFTRSERRGIIALALLSVLLFLLPNFYGLLQQPTPVDHSAFSEALADIAPAPVAEAVLFEFDPNVLPLDSLLLLGLSERTARSIHNYRSKGGQFRSTADLQKIYTLKQEDFDRIEPYVIIRSAGRGKSRQAWAAYEPRGKPQAKAETFPFDPNTASEAELRRLGLSERTAKSILNYRSKGGQFRKKEDLQKIYTLRPEDYSRLEAYVNIAERNQDKPQLADAGRVPRSYDNTLPPRENPVIDINAASVEEWQRLRGIGPYLAKRIVGFRDKLGGFSSVDQVAETRGLPDSTFQQIMLSLRPSPIPRLLNINTATADELAQHPYLSRKEASILVNYRSQHGPYSKGEDLLKTKIMTKEQVAKIAPYLTF